MDDIAQPTMEYVSQWRDKCDGNANGARWQHALSAAPRAPTACASKSSPESMVPTSSVAVLLMPSRTALETAAGAHTVRGSAMGR